MAMNREFEKHLRYNAVAPKAVAALKGIQNLFNNLRDAGIIRERPEEGQEMKPEIGLRVTSVPVMVFNKAVRFALQHLRDPLALNASNVICYEEVRQRIPGIDQLQEFEKGEALQNLLLDSIESIKNEAREKPDKQAKALLDMYATVYRTAVLGETNEKAEENLDTSRMTFYRRKDAAIQRIIGYILNAPKKDS